MPAAGSGGRTRAPRPAPGTSADRESLADDFVGEPVLHGLARGEHLVAVHVRAQGREVVVCVPGQHLLDLGADPEHLLGLEAEVRDHSLLNAAGRLAETHKIQLNIEESVYDNIASKCTQIDVGARNIDHILDQQVLPELSKRMLEAMTGDTMPKSITMGCSEAGVYTYTFA